MRDIQEQLPPPDDTDSKSTSLFLARCTSNRHPEHRAVETPSTGQADQPGQARPQVQAVLALAVVPAPAPSWPGPELQAPRS